MSKYIIRNCPAYDCSITEWNCLGSDATECKNGDCILKQIVELCKHYRKHSDCGRDCPSFGRFLDKLLDKLDIEEVE